MSIYAVVNPAAGETVKEYPTMTDDELRAAVARADEAHAAWLASSSVAERAALVRRVGELHVEQRERLGEIIVREMGKPTERRWVSSTLWARSTSTTPTTPRS